MKLKTILLALAWISAAGISYFAFDTLTSLGDFAHAWAAEPRALIFAVFVTAPAVVVAWMGIIMVEQAKTRKGNIGWLAGSVVFSWAWLYIGAIILALMRLQ